MKPFIALLFISSAVVAQGAEVRQGNYGIPAALEFGKFASFPTTYRVSVNELGKRVLTYNLPEDIVGATEVTIALTEADRFPNGMIDFVGIGGDRGTCRPGETDVTCLVEHPSLEVDVEAVEKLIDVKYPGSPDNEARKSVMRIFSNDPKGIVNYAAKWRP